MKVNKENLLRVAKRLRTNVREFNMRSYCHCGLGYAVREFEDTKDAMYIDAKARYAAEQYFGIPTASQCWFFLFGQIWANDAKACADRCEYVAIHGDAPSREQWDDYVWPKPLVVKECLEDAEELAMA